LEFSYDFDGTVARRLLIFTI